MRAGNTGKMLVPPDPTGRCTRSPRPRASVLCDGRPQTDSRVYLDKAKTSITSEDGRALRERRRTPEPWEHGRHGLVRETDSGTGQTAQKHSTGVRHASRAEHRGEGRLQGRGPRGRKGSGSRPHTSQLYTSSTEHGTPQNAQKIPRSRGG